MNATRVLEGRRESGLLAFSSVRRMTGILSKRCREQSWVRTSVATLDRFRTMSGYADLETLREQALADPVVAEGALASLPQLTSKELSVSSCLLSLAVACSLPSCCVCASVMWGLSTLMVVSSRMLKLIPWLCSLFHAVANRSSV